MVLRNLYFASRHDRLVETWNIAVIVCFQPMKSEFRMSWDHDKGNMHMREIISHHIILGVGYGRVGETSEHGVTRAQEILRRSTAFLCSFVHCFFRIQTGINLRDVVADSDFECPFWWVQRLCYSPLSSSTTPGPSPTPAHKQTQKTSPKANSLGPSVYFLFLWLTNCVSSIFSL